MVNVKIAYFGRFRDKAGLEEELSVDEDIANAWGFILKHLKNSYGFTPPFIMMVNNMHINGALKENIRLKDGDSFKLIPFLSGG